MVRKQKLATLNIYSEEIVLKRKNSRLRATNICNHSWKLSPKPFYDQTSVLKLCQSWIAFPVCMFKYKKLQDSPDDPKNLAIHSVLLPAVDFLSNCGNDLKGTVFFRWRGASDWWRVHRELRIFCAITFYSEALTKVGPINWEGIDISRSYEKQKCIRSDDEHNCSFGEEHTSIIFLNPYKLWDMDLADPAAPMLLNYTAHRGLMSNRFPQTTTQQHGADLYPVFSSLRPIDCKIKGLRVRFYQRNNLPYGRVNETVAKVENLSDFREPGALDGVPPFVMNSSCF